MEIRICSIDVENAIDYLMKKFKCTENDAVMIGNLFLTQKENNNNLNLLSREECETIVRNLTKEQTKKLRDLKACAIKFVNSNFPLTETERMISDDFTYLSAADGSASLMVTLARKTNHSEMLFIFSNYRWVENEIRQLDCSNASSERVGGAITFMTILKAFLGGISSGAGTKVFNMLFPTDYFNEENYLQIRDIMRDEITKDTIAAINGAVTTSMNTVKNNYNPQKEAKVSVEKLIPLIDVESSAQIGLRTAIGTLVDDRYKALGLPVYIIAVSALINVYEELISIEPDKAKVQAHKASIILYVKGALKHIEEALQIITNHRCNYLVKRDNCIGSRLDDHGVSQFFIYFDFTDKLTGYNKIFEKIGCKSTPGADRDSAMQSYAKSLSDKIIANLAYSETIKAWNKIIEKYKK